VIERPDVSVRLPHGKDAILDIRKIEDNCLSQSHPRGHGMKRERSERMRVPGILDVVALLVDFPDQRLARGQVGTVVEQLSDEILLVEFSDDDGRAYAIAPCAQADLLVLHYVPEAA
jgi:hypothetical protein